MNAQKKKLTVGTLTDPRRWRAGGWAEGGGGGGQMPRMTESEAFLFTHEIIDNLGSTSGGTGPES